MQTLVFTTEKRIYNLSNLQEGEEYCVQVLPDFGVNRNSEPSDWVCAFTSILGPNRGRLSFRYGYSVSTVLLMSYR